MVQPKDIAMLTATENTVKNGNNVPIPVGILPPHKDQDIENSAFTAPEKQATTLFHNPLRPLRMIIDKDREVRSLRFVDDQSLKSPLSPDEVEIKALAYALDETDIDIMLGNRANATSIGECAGVVTAVGSNLEHVFQVGDRVCGWNTNIAFASQTRIKGSFVQKMPKAWSAGMGAALPQNVSIAYYGLSDCAQVKSGQTVLVHGASSSLGLAVTLVANALGLQTIATVKTEAEKQVLMSYNGTKPAHILYSDDVVLRQTLLDLTMGAGVDVLSNASATALSEELIKAVAPFGIVVEMGGQNSCLAGANCAITYVSFDAAQLLRQRPSFASTAFQSVLTLLREEYSDDLFPIRTVPIANVALALEDIRREEHIGKMVLLADDDAMVHVDEAISVYHSESSAEGSLASASSISEARKVIFEGQLRKLASLVALSTDEVSPRKPLVDLGLDSMMVIEFRDWLRREFGADVDMHDITDATGLEALATLVLQKSTFVPRGLLKGSSDALRNVLRKSVANGSATISNDITNGLAPSNGVEKSEFLFVPNRLPRFPLPDIDALCNAFLNGVEAFATPAEFADTIRAVEEFKRPGSAGRALYDRAAARAADPNVENWEFELQLRRGFLDRRVSLTPCTSFWFGHPFSNRQHSQAERAALLAYTANNFRLKLKAGLVKPVVLSNQELTTAYYPWIFNAVRIPRVGSDEMQRYPSDDYCVVFWKGHAFRIDLRVGNRPATQQELLAAFEWILTQSMGRSFVSIFTSDNRHPWAETRQQLLQLNSENAASIATIEAAAFTVSLDEAAPMTAAERGRQFHFGGEKDSANRWHDKSLQFVVCSNGVSGTLGEHTMLDAMTLSELNDAIAIAVSSHTQFDFRDAVQTITPVPLPLKTDATLNAHMDKVRTQYANIVKGGEHAPFLFEGYGSKFLRAQKLAPNSVFQMIVQLAAQSLYGYTTPCFETVNHAHYHLGRVDIIQVVIPQVAAFLAAARDPSVGMVERRALLHSATRAHVALVNKARRNLGWERNFTALRALLEKGEPVPALYDDPVYKRVRPRLLISNCFETGMLEKGCMSKDPEAVWLHYEVYEESVYFSVVTMEGGRATRFCEHLKEAAEVVRQITFTE